MAMITTHAMHNGNNANPCHACQSGCEKWSPYNMHIVCLCSHESLIFLCFEMSHFLKTNLIFSFFPQENPTQRCTRYWQRVDKCLLNWMFSGDMKDVIKICKHGHISENIPVLGKLWDTLTIQILFCCFSKDWSQLCLCLPLRGKASAQNLDKLTLLFSVKKAGKAEQNIASFKSQQGIQTKPVAETTDHVQRLLLIDISFLLRFSDKWCREDKTLY